MGFWQKIKENRFLFIAACVVAAVLLIYFLSFFKIKSDYLIWLVILLCPLMHIFMMKHHNHKLYKCPECGFEYEEKEWVDKCEAWCKEHKTCNIEIIKHAKVENSKD